MNNIFGGSPHRSAFEKAQAGRDTWSYPAGRVSYDPVVKPESIEGLGDDFYLSRRNAEEDRGCKRVFYPITEEWQKDMAAKFKMKVVRSYKHGATKYFYDKTSPRETIPVEGDGNCFFRALSMCITGTENEHMRIRELITKHVEENPEMYRTFLQSRGGMNQYLTSMRRPKEWATDVEILAAATLLKTIIEVYFPCRIKGKTEFRWQTFKPLTHPDITYPAIYLSNKNDHFDPVLDVNSEDDTSETRSSVRSSHSESLRQSQSRVSHDPTVYSEPLSSRKSYSKHTSSFDRIYGVPSSYSTRKDSPKQTHPSVQF